MATGSSLALSSPTSPSGPVEGDKLTFHWSTDVPDATNWVGIYDGTRQPGNGSSLVWKYVPGTSGDLTLDTSALTGGPYTAYLLAKDGYSILAQSTPFSFTPKPVVIAPHSAVDALTATPVRPGGQLRVKLGGLWARPAGNAAGSATFRRISGDSWLSVSADGTVTGTAPGKALAHPAIVTVGVKDSTGATDTVTVQVPVVEPKGKQALKVASWNLWDAGTHSTDGFEKQLRVILTQGWDVVGLQETAGSNAQQLADALGWYAYQSPGSVGVLSRYPLTDVTPVSAALPAAGVTVQLPGGPGIRLWTAHLDENSYGPYAIQDGASPAAVIAAETGSVRYQQAQALIAAIKGEGKGKGEGEGEGKGPVILAGELSSPSHLDWTAATHGSALDWPVTEAFQAAGLTDSFREDHPDPAQDPGTTWSPTRKTRGSKPEPQDRIDYVLYADTGRIELREGHVIATGWPSPEPNAATNGWPSDTAAAVATFAL
ncbi:endonuclease/exonuclease/phosphatase family protein [Kitasatospora kifunensis]|uniref:Endonuclease/exonuclease/phosphatase family metal-dependent hydrolase n=1 Tax=Kitasatospora kifunensis TaxID=58351 RepID=A0A7W7VXT2_KITKI|nr:endonuclease/exonuclease/phosphatase family protein [Kitasatospora kifunensis]MBB4925920.1 endonuclease/exonuclease/phosphatase family metal-dependent hydrolase [Kitasatospora kifunensis]